MTPTEANIEKERQYEEFRQRVINELIPENIPYDESKYTHQVVDPHWDTGESWYDRSRLTAPITIDQSGIRKYNEALSHGGRIVTIVESKPISDAIK